MKIFLIFLAFCGFVHFCTLFLEISANRISIFRPISGLFLRILYVVTAVRLLNKIFYIIKNAVRASLKQSTYRIFIYFSGSRTDCAIARSRIMLQAFRNIARIVIQAYSSSPKISCAAFIAFSTSFSSIRTVTRISEVEIILILILEL